MSSHREAPEISKDPVADSTDLYAFVSPDRPDTVTLIANYVPLQAPDGGPNFYEFGDDVLYAINIDNDGDGDADISYQFQFTSTDHRPQHLPLQHRSDHQSRPAPLEPTPDLLASPGWTRQRQPRPRHRARLPAVQHRAAVHPGLRGPGGRGRHRTRPAGSRSSPASGRRASTSTWVRSSTWATSGRSSRTTPRSACRHRTRPDGQGGQLHRRGQRPQHRPPGADQPADGERQQPTSVTDPAAVIGVWTTASRQKARIIGDPTGEERQLRPVHAGVPAREPARQRGAHPDGRQGLLELANRRPTDQPVRVLRRHTRSWPGCSPCSIPGVFPNLAAYVSSGAPRADLLAILLTGIPTGVVPGFQNYTGPRAGRHAAPERRHPADDQRCVEPGTHRRGPGRLPQRPEGVRRRRHHRAAGDRRGHLPLVDPSYTPDGAAGAISMGLTSGPGDLTAMGTERYLPTFPYLGTPHSGFAVPAAS